MSRCRPPPTVGAWLPRAPPQLSPASGLVDRALRRRLARRGQSARPCCTGSARGERRVRRGGLRGRKGAAPGARRDRGCVPARELSARNNRSPADLDAHTSRVRPRLPRRPRAPADSRRQAMEGVPVTGATPLRRAPRGQTIRSRSATGRVASTSRRMTSPGRLGFAPFIVRPSASASIRVAIVLPTRTWQAYNFRDDGGDGKGDTWYALEGSSAVPARPPVPEPRRPAALPPTTTFASCAGCMSPAESVDVLSQAELDGTTGERLARRTS